MSTQQLTLDLWPVAQVDEEEHDTRTHQRGLCVLPHDCGLGRTGDAIPAWICCQCGAAEPTEFTLSINHACGAFRPHCPGPTAILPRFRLLEATS